GADRLLAQAARTSSVRRVLAGPRGGQAARGAAAEGAYDDRARALGPGGHLRAHRGVQGARAKGHEQRQSVSRARAVASRAADTRGEHARRAEIPRGYRDAISSRNTAAVSR